MVSYEGDEEEDEEVVEEEDMGQISIAIAEPAVKQKYGLGPLSVRTMNLLWNLIGGAVNPSLEGIVGILTVSRPMGKHRELAVVWRWQALLELLEMMSHT